jgi:hypothetical protein
MTRSMPPPVGRPRASASGTAKNQSQEGLVFGSVARLPLVGPEHRWVGRQKTNPMKVGISECGTPPVGRPRASTGGPDKNQSQEGLVFGSVARLPLVGLEHQLPVERDLKQSRTHTQKGEYPRRAHGRERQLFRLIDHWKRRSFSGSFCIGIKFRFQAHSTIGKC